MLKHHFHYSIDWHRAYLSFLNSGLSMAAFRRTRLREFSLDGHLPSSIRTVYFHFNKERNSLAASGPTEEFPRDEEPRSVGPEPAVPAIRSSTRGSIQVIEVKAEALEAVCRGGNHASVPARSGQTLFRIRLPNGASASFRTSRPEELALRMMLGCGGGAK